MRLIDFLKENVINGENLLIYVKLDVGTKESYEVEIMRGCRNNINTPGWTKDYKDWLEAMNLEVETVSSCKQDTCGNKDLLCIKCKTIKINNCQFVKEKENGRSNKD